MEQVTIDGGAGILDSQGDIDRPELAPGLRIALATGQLRRPLHETLRPLLDLLVDGRYAVTGPERLHRDFQVTPVDDWPPADPVRIEYYRAAIRTGHKPVVVLLDVHILDGHHKIAAYQAEGIPPVVVRITATP